MLPGGQFTMKKIRNSFCCLIAGGLLVTTGHTLAAPVVAVDMDPSVMGIQSTLSVPLGTTFTVGIVAWDDGVPPTPILADSVILETFFNDAGVVLIPGPTGPLAGGLAGSGTAMDFFGFVPTVPGAPLTVGPPSVAVPPLFTAGTGAVGLLDPFPFMLGLAPSPAGSVYSIDFTAVAVGTSDIVAAGSPLGSPEFALAGFPVGASLIPGMVTVMPPGGGGGGAVPEPSEYVLMGFGLLGVLVWHQRRRRVPAPASL